MNINLEEKKAVFIAYNQTHEPHLRRLLSRLNLKGYTSWEGVQGQGSETGLPHLGTHVWPEQNNAMLVVLEAEKLKVFLAGLHQLNDELPEHGLRAFVWSVEVGV